MLRTLVVTFALAAVPVSALAAERISDASYVAASRCAAFQSSSCVSAFSSSSGR